MDRLSNLGIKEISSGEEVIKIVHRHWFDILGQYLISFMIFFAMAGVLIVIPVYFPGMHEQGDFFYIVFFLSFFSFLFFFFFGWWGLLFVFFIMWTYGLCPARG